MYIFVLEINNQIIFQHSVEDNGEPIPLGGCVASNHKAS